MSEKFSWLLGTIKAEDAERLQRGIQNAGIGMFASKLQISPVVIDGKQVVNIEIPRHTDIDQLHQEHVQLLAYFFRLHNDTQGANVDLHLYDFLEEAD